MLSLWVKCLMKCLFPGIALLHLHCACILGDHNEQGVAKCYLESSLRTIRPFLRVLDTHRPTFLCGAAGPLAVAAVLYHKLGKEALEFQKYWLFPEL